MTKDRKNETPLLKVEHLHQYFKLGKKELPAVNDVSFDVYKGEVFGLVGESGCGKTTTGRTIIRLYDATGGSVYFDGKRIVAGTRTYKDAILAAQKECNAIKKEANDALTKAAFDFKGDEAKLVAAQKACDEKIAKAKAAYDEVYFRNMEEIKKAKYDHKNCNKEFAKNEVAKVNKKYADLLAKRKSNPNGLTDKENEEYNRYKNEFKLAKKERIMNKIQMIFQDPIASLDPRMTIRDIIAEGLIIRGIKDKKYIDEQVYKMLEYVGLVSEHATRYPHEFSGGQRQRIGIARSIILNPELIIADEPISALDVSIQAQVINLLNELRRKMGLTIIFIAHDLSVVKYFSDRIAVMYFGKIVELASSEDLFEHPLHPYTKSLLSAIPLPDPEYEKDRRRINYVPLRDHDYSKEGPTMREITPGHFIYCNSEEFEKYKKEVNSKK